MAFEVFLDNIPLPRDAKSKAKKKLELSPLQAVDKDLAFVVARNVSAVSIAAAAKNADRSNIDNIYLPEDKKSVAISVTFQPKDKTYTDAELEALMNKVILEVGKKTGAVLR